MQCTLKDGEFSKHKDLVWKCYLGWWTTMQMFTPSRASRLSALRSSWEEALSKPDVGSSRIKSEGSITISKPTFTRFLWPPEIPRFSTVPTKEPRTCWSPKDSITLSTTKTLSGSGKSADNLQKFEVHHKKVAAVDTVRLTYKIFGHTNTISKQWPSFGSTFYTSSYIRKEKVSTRNK